MEKEEYNKICHDAIQRLMKMHDIDIVTVGFLIPFACCKMKNGCFCYLTYCNEFNEEQYVSMNKVYDAYGDDIERFLIDFAIENKTDIMFYLYGRKIKFIPKAKSLEELLVWLDLNER